MARILDPTTFAICVRARVPQKGDLLVDTAARVARGIVETYDPLTGDGLMRDVVTAATGLWDWMAADVADNAWGAGLYLLSGRGLDIYGKILGLPGRTLSEADHQYRSRLLSAVCALPATRNRPASPIPPLPPLKLWEFPAPDTKRSASVGPLKCNWCATTNEYAEPNQPDGSYICYSCKVEM